MRNEKVITEVVQTRGCPKSGITGWRRVNPVLHPSLILFFLPCSLVCLPPDSIVLGLLNVEYVISKP